MPVTTSHGLVRENTHLYPQNRHQMQTSALSAGLHMLHHQADGCVHPRLRAGQLHRMAEFGRGLQRAYMRGVALGVEHMKDHLAFSSHAIGLRRAAVQTAMASALSTVVSSRRPPGSATSPSTTAWLRLSPTKRWRGSSSRSTSSAFGGAGTLLFQKIHAFIRHHDSS